MKIGILTFHLGLNHGGFLQAYSMQRFLEEMGHEVSIINYKNRIHWKRQHVLPWITPQKPWTLIRHFKKWKSFQPDFKLLNTSFFTTDSGKIEKLGLDLVVIGSDIVWNTELFGEDLAYFGNFNVPGRVAYAPSFGWMSEETVLSEEVVHCLLKFDDIFVRDHRTQAIIKRNTNIDCQIVCDPSLLISWDQIFSGGTDKYLLVYAFALSAEWRDKICEYADSKGLAIVSVGYPTGLPGKLIMEIGPLNWVEMIFNASCVVTNTFHGTIFSSLSGKPFVSVDNGPSSLRNQSYLRVIHNLDRLLQIPENLSVLLSKPVSDDVRGRISELRGFSANILQQALLNADPVNKSKRS